eukprot:TRINITY_DN2042_c0_g1_i5.p1 TRINITY_DN2042_c0_g1~~TRINITY_DN2042_c0_g1_i5.p1  ORF type:complete len:955 (+),score=257.56 TRINITY_DN2042_c0_g1_i5:50-2914(+)
MTMYVVRGVPSSDTLSVVPQKTTNPLTKPTMINVSQIESKRLGRLIMDDGEVVDIQEDDEYAWEAREFVRSKVIGKTIKFKKEGYIDSLARDVGEVFYQENGKAVNLGVTLVEKGLAVLRVGGKPNEYTKALAVAECEAKEAKVGVHSGDDITEHIRHVVWDIPDSAEHDKAITQFNKKFKGKQVSMVVEHVMTASHVKVMILPEMIQASLHLGGIVSASKTGSEFTDEKEKKNAIEVNELARATVEKLILNRDIKVVVENPRYSGTVGGTIVSGDKVFQCELLSKGLVKIHDQTILGATHRARLKEAQAGALAAKLGLWKFAATKQVVTGGMSSKAEDAKPTVADFVGTVFSIVSADTIMVFNEATQEEVRVNFASIRAGGSPNSNLPKKKGDGDDTNKTQAPSTFAKMDRNNVTGTITYSNWFLEGRDFLRPKLLGKKVKVHFEYMAMIPVNARADADKSESKDSKDPPRLEKEPRPAFTVYCDGMNPATEVVKNGWGVVVYSKDGESRDMEAYCDAMEKAKTDKKGLWSGKSPKPIKVNDIKSDKNAKGTLSLLQSSGPGTSGVARLKATVEYVLAPNRLKLYIPRENLQVAVNQAGICCPSLGMDNETPDPLAKEALAFAKKVALQRDVEVTVDTFFGTSFIGNIFIKDKSYAAIMLEEGLATMEGQNLSSMSHRSETEAAEKKAKAAKKGVHSQGLPKKALRSIEKFEKRAGGRSVFAMGDRVKVDAEITEIIDGNRFYFQNADCAAKMSQIVDALNDLALDSMSPPDSISDHEYVAARFSQDKKWYRARVLRSAGGKYDVFYIDFGNRESLPKSQIRKSPKFQELLNKFPAQATEGYLAFMHELPPTETGGMDAKYAFEDFTQGGKITIAHEYTCLKKKYFTVRAGTRALQEYIINRGFGCVALDVIENKVDELEKAVNHLSKLEKKAKDDRIGMWDIIRGDPRSYDE